mgnify:FL=1
MNPIKLVVIFIFSLGLMACGSSSEKLVVTPPASALTMAFTADKTFHFTWPAATSAMYYELYEATTVGAGFTLIKSTALLEFDHVVPLYARLNAKYMLKSCSASACSSSTAIFTSTKLAAMTSSIGLKRATTPVAGHMFGYSVSLSSDGSTLAVGAQQATVDNVTKVGEVTIFKQSVLGTDWVYQQTIRAFDGAQDDEFGSAISLSADGNVLAVSASLEDNTKGSVYVFTRTGASFATVNTDVGYIQAGDKAVNDYFGTSVSLSADGGTLAVGQFDDNNAAHTGAVYVFTGSGDAWTQQNKLVASNAGANDKFGVSISLSSDGNILAIGAPGEDEPIDAGAVYVFTRTDAVWNEKKILSASNAQQGDNFGYSLSLSDDGASLAVGAPFEDSTSTTINVKGTDTDVFNSGAVYVFTGSGATWTENAYLKADNAAQNDVFGWGVSLNSDGTVLAVGAPGEDSVSTEMNNAGTDTVDFNSGAVYVFTGSGATWAQQAYLKASNPGSNDNVGVHLSLSGDGTVLAVGVPDEDGAENGTTDSGAVYLY